MSLSQPVVVINWKRAIWAFLLMVLLNLGALVQGGLTERVRGSHMSMPFLLTAIVCLGLMVLYILVIICDRFVNSMVLWVGAILLQGLGYL